MTSKQHNQTYTPSLSIIDILNQLPLSVRYKIANEIKHIDNGPELDDSVFDQSGQPVDEAVNQNKNITDETSAECVSESINITDESSLLC